MEFPTEDHNIDLTFNILSEVGTRIGYSDGEKRRYLVARYRKYVCFQATILICTHNPFYII